MEKRNWYVKEELYKRKKIYIGNYKKKIAKENERKERETNILKEKEKSNI